MSTSRSLSSGSNSPSGSIVNILVVILVVIVLLLCAGVFVLYNQDKGSSNDATQAQQAYAMLNNSYNDLSGRYSALVANNTDLSERFDELNVDYQNVSDNYASLKNQSDTSMIKLGEFMETDPTVVYKYNVAANASSNDSSSMNLTVNVYNIGKEDANNVIVRLTYQSTVDNATGQMVKTIDTIPSLGKKQVYWPWDNTSRVLGVWVGIS